MTAAAKLKNPIKSKYFFPRLWRKEKVELGHLTLKLAKLRNTARQECKEDQTDFAFYCARHLQESHSQIFQDLFVLYILGEKRDGFFCEFGATNGMELSNSLMLESTWDWKGICAEPARGWHPEFRKNRPKTTLETNCVWSVTGETLVFNEVRARALSTIDSFSTEDGHARKRRGRRSNTYEVQTICLTDLFRKYDAPSDLDFLSIDTEGSEYEILQHLDFESYSPKIIAAEHNYTENRELIHSLLKSKGYRRHMTKYSMFDDWYIHESVTPAHDPGPEE